jgi:hypothetical protein
LIDEELVKLSSNIEDVEAEIKASTDPDEKKLLRKKEEQLRDKELILLRRQDGSDKLFISFFVLYVRSVMGSNFRVS